MTTKSTKIKPYNDGLRPQLLDVWEQSVLATHHFVSESDFQDIREQVQTIDFNAYQVYCLMLEEQLIGFIGLTDKKIEMLFLHPGFIGQGYGKMLMNFALRDLAANAIDVNEQNDKALAFYRKFGFELFERTEKDDYGRNFPLLRLKLKTAN